MILFLSLALSNGKIIFFSSSSSARRDLEHQTKGGKKRKIEKEVPRKWHLYHFHRNFRASFFFTCQVTIFSSKVGRSTHNTTQRKPHHVRETNFPLGGEVKPSDY